MTSTVDPQNDLILPEKEEEKKEEVEVKEEPVCRMCHCESELPDRPLYFPCKCDGSIRLVILLIHII